VIPKRTHLVLRPASAGRTAFYRLRSVTATEESVTAAEISASQPNASLRVVQARSRAEQRLTRQRDTLRPLGWAVILAVVVEAAGGHPGPRLDGTGIGVTIALGLFIATLAIAIGDRFPQRSPRIQVAVILAMGAAGVWLDALQPRGATELAAGAAVWIALARLPLGLGVATGAAITIALDVAGALSGSSSSAVVAGTLLCALLGLVAHFVKQSRESQNRTELLLAQLEDAREEQTRAAAIAERGRIAAELHDVLAHSLSGAAIQLQGARLLAEREQAPPRIREAIDRATELVKEGLRNARQAVGALRGEELPSIAQLDSLIQSFKTDMNLDATLTIQGRARTLSPDASLALYRGAQEALTNVARYAPGARTIVVLRYGSNRTTLTVEDRVPADGTARPRDTGGLSGVGGGRGLAGMRERLERAGGSMHAGPTDGGWCVELDVPA
jgi:signal transduction histidine kinase